MLLNSVASALNWLIHSKTLKIYNKIPKDIEATNSEPSRFYCLNEGKV